MRILVAAAALFMTSCTSAADRCSRISTDALLNELYESSEQRFQEELAKHRDYRKSLMEDSDSIRVRIRHQVRARLSVTGDTATPTPKPPPRPSDLEWYAEHCYKGEAR
jgi:hypothetical protein